MRKLVLPLMICLITLGSDLFAQDRKVVFGLTASPLISWMKADNAAISKGKVRAGLEYGLLMDINFTQNYAIGTGTTIIMEGGNLGFGGATTTFKLQYFQLPVVMKLRTNQIGYITYFGQFGILPAFRIRARVDVDLPGSADIENENIIKDNNAINATSNFFNLSLQVGGGIEWNFAGNTALVLGIIYNNGFVNQLDDTDDDKVLINSLLLRAAVNF